MITKIRYYMPKGLRLEELEVYKIAMEIGEQVWKVVGQWDYFAKKTLGGQFIEAADPIALNIAEGYGRFHFKENKNFCYYSRGSAKETLTALRKAKFRSLVAETYFAAINQNLELYFRIMYGYIQSIGITKNEGIE